MITIENLQVLFEATREKDEQLFEEMFRAQMARHDADRRREHDAAKQADSDRCVTTRSAW